jgi:hypothetical protein
MGFGDLPAALQRSSELLILNKRPFRFGGAGGPRGYIAGIAYRFVE